MSETGDLLDATATRLFEQRLGEAEMRASRRGELPVEGWQAVEEAGLPLALLSEAEGGFGIEPVEALNLIRIGGYFGSPVPLAETMFANLVLARCGLPLAEGPATIAIANAEGIAAGVPWARHARTIVVALGNRILRADPSQVSIESDFSGSGLARDLVHFTGDGTGPASPLPDLRAAGALCRALEMAGALQRVVELTVSYAQERVQFGRPIAKQQAIQQQIAALAGQAAAAGAAADLAARMFGGPHEAAAVAAAKSRAGEAAGIGAAIAHQVHGAIGFTQEHRLHLFTRALWAWRDEYGSEAEWEALLGSEALAGGAEDYWPFLTAIQPAAGEG